MIVLDPEQFFDTHRLNEAADRYFDALLEENKNVNLVSRETARAGLRKLYSESLLPIMHCDLLPKSYLDVGSGGGFPAIPILSTLSISGTLVERTKKKSAALQRIVARLGLSAEILSVDAAEIPRTRMFELITLRYVRLTVGLLSTLTQHLSPDGALIYYSSRIEPEIMRRGDVSRETTIFRLAQDDTDRGFTLFHKLS